MSPSAENPFNKPPMGEMKLPAEADLNVAITAARKEAEQARTENRHPVGRTVELNERGTHRRSGFADMEASATKRDAEVAKEKEKMADEARQKLAVEERKRSPEVAGLNEAAAMRIYGTPGKEQFDPKTGASLGKPDEVKGAVERFYDSTAGKPKELRDKLTTDFENTFMKDVDKYVKKGLELTQAEALATIRQEERQAKANSKYEIAAIEAKMVAGGMAPAEARPKAKALYEKKHAGVINETERVKLTKEKGLMTLDEIKKEVKDAAARADAERKGVEYKTPETQPTPEPSKISPTLGHNPPEPTPEPKPIRKPYDYENDLDNEGSVDDSEPQPTPERVVVDAEDLDPAHEEDLEAEPFDSFNTAKDLIALQKAGEKRELTDEELNILQDHDMAIEFLNECFLFNENKEIVGFSKDILDGFNLEDQSRFLRILEDQLAGSDNFGNRIAAIRDDEDEVYKNSYWYKVVDLIRKSSPARQAEIRKSIAVKPLPQARVEDAVPAPTEAPRTLEQMSKDELRERAKTLHSLLADPFAKDENGVNILVNGQPVELTQFEIDEIKKELADVADAYGSAKKPGFRERRRARKADKPQPEESEPTGGDTEVEPTPEPVTATIDGEESSEAVIKTKRQRARQKIGQAAAKKVFGEGLDDSDKTVRQLRASRVRDGIKKSRERKAEARQAGAENPVDPLLARRRTEKVEVGPDDVERDEVPARSINQLQPAEVSALSAMEAAHEGTSFTLDDEGRLVADGVVLDSGNPLEIEYLRRYIEQNEANSVS